MLVVRHFKSIIKEVTCCGNCPWMELVPEMGMGSIPTCMHKLFPGKGGYESAVHTDVIDKRCPLSNRRLLKVDKSDLYKLLDLLPQRPHYYTHAEPEGFKELLKVWEDVTQHEKVEILFKGKTFTVSPKEILDELSLRRGCID